MWYGSYLYKVSLSFKKPFIVDAKESYYYDIKLPSKMKNDVYPGLNTVDTDGIVDWAYRNGYDGVIIKNVFEGNGSSEYGDDYIIFSKDSIMNVENVSEIETYSIWGANFKRLKKENNLTEKYVHYINIKENSIVDPLVDFKDHLAENKKNVEYINKYLRDRGKTRFMPNSLIKLYHGTSPKIPILDDGIKTTKMRTSHSYQSTLGYTYFSIYPSMAEIFGNMGFGIHDSAVYECLIPICEIEPDLDQIRNKRLYSGMYEIGNTIGDSIIYGHGVRVRGDIPPYMIRKIK
jgi:hypothetical protein